MSGRSLRRAYVAGSRCLEAELRLHEGRLQGTLTGDGEMFPVDVAVRRLGPHAVALEHVDRRVRATVLLHGDTTWICIDGRTHQITIEEAGGPAARHGGEDDFAVSPMTGMLRVVACAAGDVVAKGEELFVVEAMKMEYVVRAPRDLSVAEVRCAAGASVEQGQIVMAFEEAP